MAGLLDFIGTPEGQGLLSAAFGGLAGARRGQPLNSLGRAGLSGLSGYADATDRQTQADQLAKRNQMFDLQLAQLRQAQTDAEARKALAQQSVMSPTAMALSQNGGPTLAAAKALPTTAPGFDYKRYGQGLAALGDVNGALAIEQAIKKDTTFKMGRDDRLLESGTNRVLVDALPKESTTPSDYLLWELSGAKARGVDFDTWDLSRRRAGASNVTTTYGTPTEGIDPTTGKRVFFRPPTKGGKVEIMTDVTPVPKEMPEGIRNKIAENNVVLEKIRKAKDAATDKPNSFGMQNALGDTIMQRWDPDGVEARAFVADIAGQKIHDRSGAAVSVGESERLKPYIPNATDLATTVQKKLKAFEAEYSAMQRELQSGASVGQVSAAKAEAPVRVRKYNKETGKLE